jgi:radical SAM protein with 4Fe4S-binding SPASM domain
MAANRLDAAPRFLPMLNDATVAAQRSRESSLQARTRVFDRVFAKQAPPLPHGYASNHVIRLHELDLYVTMRCNIRCQFCNVRAGEYGAADDLPLARITSLLDEAHALGLQEAHFLGGEPAVRDDLEAMIQYGHRLGLHTRIITNGMMLSWDRMQALVDAGLNEIMISVDGMEATHNRLRKSGRDGWRTTMACVEAALALGLRTRVSMVAYRDNEHEIVDLLHHVERMGVDIFSVFLGSPLGRGHTMLDRVVDPFAWRSIQRRVGIEAEPLRESFHVVLEQGFAWPGEPLDRSQLKGRGTGCNTLLEDFDYLIVRSDGNLYQCVFFMTEGAPIGNVREQPLRETLQYALDVAEYRQFTVANDKCTTCFHQVDCGTGCRGYAYLYTADWLRTDPRCAKTDPRHTETPAFYPVCPIMKLNVRTGRLGGSTEQSLEASSAPAAPSN